MSPSWVRQDRLLTRLRTLERTFTKICRILTGRREVLVRFANQRDTGVPAPAFGNGREICIHLDRFNNIGSTETLVALLGAFYHETCHLLFTPRIGRRFRIAVESEGLSTTFNLLEDQRIETLFCALYGSAGKFFTEMFLRFFTQNEQFWPVTHLFSYGRRYLPLELRSAFADRWIKYPRSRKDKKRAEEIIDEFRLLDLSNVDFDNVLSSNVIILVREFDEILKRAHKALGQDMPNPMSDDKGDCDQSLAQDNPDGDTQKTAQRRAEEKTAEQDEQEEDGEDGSGFWDDVEDGEGDGDEEDSEEDESDSDSDDDDDGDEGARGGSDSEDDDDGTDSDDGSGDDGEGDDDGETGDEGRRGDGSDDEGEGDEGSDDDSVDESASSDGVGGQGKTELDEEISSILDDAMNAIYNSAQVKDEVRKVEDVMNDPDAFDLDFVERSDVTWTPMEPEVGKAARDAEKELKRLYAEFEPGWKYGSDSGRLNVQRAMHSDDFEDVFDEWDEGREQDSGLEVVIAVDTSVSMRGDKIDRTYEALWVIKRACDVVGATVSVMSFDEETQTVFTRKTAVRPTEIPRFGDLGGDTKPAQSFRNARRVLSQTDKPNRLFVIITDGQWSPANDQGNPENLRELIQTIPATRMFIGIGTISNQYAAEFDISKTIYDAGEIGPLVKSAITHMIRQAAASRR